MSTTGRILKTAGVSAGILAGVAGSAYVAQRAALAAIRRRPDPDAGTLGEVQFDDARHLAAGSGLIGIRSR